MSTDHLSPEAQKAAEADIMAARLAAIVANSDDVILSKTLDGIITSWNGGAERIFGYSAEEMIGRHISTIIPPELIDEEKQIIARLSKGERIEHFETVRVAKDGRRIDISLTVSPLRDATGRIVGASKVARDISDRKRAEETQRLLHDELHHRIKNTLATVQAIATQTLRRAKTPAAFVSSFNGRIQALARAHRLLTGASFQGADVLDLIREQLMLGGAEDQRIAWSGPSLTLEAQVALHLALVIHELGTNARKHGALSTPHGKVEVRWEVVSHNGRHLRLSWIESGGPPVSAPAASGFGSVLIEHSLQAHGGEVVMRYGEGGLTCHIDLPLSDLHQSPLGDLSREASGHTSLSQSSVDVLAGKRILIVEDEPLIAMVLTDYLLDANCDIAGPAQNVEKAKQMAAEETIDAALVDGNLSGRRVDEIVAALAAREIPFAFVTGYGREALPPGYASAPIVEKPFTQEQVLGALRHLFADGANVIHLPRRGG